MDTQAIYDFNVLTSIVTRENAPLRQAQNIVPSFSIVFAVVSEVRFVSRERTVTQTTIEQIGMD